MKTKSKKSKHGLVVTSEHRGVFFGYATTKRASENKRIVLTECRMCIRWSMATHGVFGLATQGPDSQCRIGPAVSEHEILDVTSVAICTQEAIEQWEAEPWN